MPDWVSEDLAGEVKKMELKDSLNDGTTSVNNTSENSLLTNSVEVNGTDKPKAKDEPEDEEERSSITFWPPVYLQRYGKVREALAAHLAKLEPGSPRSVVELGCAEFGMHFHLKHLPNIQKIIYVDIDKDLLTQRLETVKYLPYESLCKRETPLTVEVYAGCATQLEHKIKNSDPPVQAIIGIEILEHLNKDVEEKFVYNLFKNYAPPLIVLTTPNGDFNPVFSLEKGKFRHWDHRFELSRKEFQDWCSMVVTNFPWYSFTISGIAEGPPGSEDYGCVSQMAVFELKADAVPGPIPQYEFRNDSFRVDRPSRKQTEEPKNCVKDLSYFDKETSAEPYELLFSQDYPWEVKAPLPQRVAKELRYFINMYTLSPTSIDEHYENGGGDTMFLDLPTILYWIHSRLPETKDEDSESVLLWLKDEGGFEIIQLGDTRGLQVPIPEEVRTEDEDYDDQEEGQEMDTCSDCRRTVTVDVDDDWDA